MSNVVVAICSLLIGAALSEWIRRVNRIETFVPLVFNRRFDAYEQLWKQLLTADRIAHDVMNHPDLKAEERRKLENNLVMELAEFCDEKQMLLSEDLIVHCCTLFMEVASVQGIAEENERRAAIARYSENYAKAKDMIRQETGLARLDKLLGTITKARYSSDVIDYYRQAKKDRANKIRHTNSE